MARLCARGGPSAAPAVLSRAKLRPSTAMPSVVRSVLPSRLQPQPPPAKPPATASSPEQAQQYHRHMQQLLQKQRQAVRERQAAAAAAAAAAADRPSLPPSSPPPPPPLPQSPPGPHASEPVPLLPDHPRSTSQGLTTAGPQGCMTAGPRPPRGVPTETGRRAPPQAAAPSLGRQPAPATCGAEPPVAMNLQTQGLPPPYQPRAQPQLQLLGLQQQQSSLPPPPPPNQLQHMPHGPPPAAAAPPPPPPPRQPRREPPPRRPLPNLLPGASSAKTAKTTTHAGASAIGLNLLHRTSPQTDSASGIGAGGVIVGSTRTAKASFASPPPTAARTTWSVWRPYSYGSRDGRESDVLSADGRQSADLPQPSSAKRTGHDAPVAQQSPLALNPNMPYGAPVRSVLQSAIGTDGAMPAVGATMAAVAAAGGAVGEPSSATADNAGPRSTTSSSSGAATATAAGPGKAEAKAAKKKPARPTALWLSSFVHAAGRAGGSVAAGAAPAGTAAAAAAAAKQPTADAGALAAAMVRAAADRPAAELADAVSDLPATIPQLQARLEAAVQAEQESELRALRALYASGSLRQLQREGVVLVGLQAADAGRLYRSTLWRFGVMQTPRKGRTAAAANGGGVAPPALPYHKLRPGASVIITAHAVVGDGGGGGAGSMDAETGLPANGVEGVVVEAHKDHLLVAMEGRSHETFQAMVSEVMRAGAGRGGGGRGGGAAAAQGTAAAAAFLGWRLDQSVRDTTTRRHLEGIRRLGAWAESSADERLGEARVRAVLAGSRSASLMAAEPPAWVKEDRWRENARAALVAQPGLNDSQRRAVAAALTRTVTLWQGPPGTGKTRTLLALIEILVRVRKAGQPTPGGGGTRILRGSSRAAAAAAAASPRAAAMGPVLAVADTNAAVDNLVEGLAARGVAAVRLGPAAKARESLRHLSLEAQAEATTLGRKAVALRSQALRKQELWREASRPGAPGMDAGAAAAAAVQAAEVRADLERAESALREAAAAVVAAAEVVVATCTAAGDSILDGRPWRCVVVDEASQATEPSVLVALTRGSAFVVMAGDPRQLPPTVLSEAALQYGLDVTLFERVAGSGGVTPLLLDTQYRMHPAISAFPSAFFYGGRLKDGVGAADKPVPKGFAWPHPAKPLALVHVAGGREETSGGMAELAAITANSGGGGGGGGGGSKPTGSEGAAAVAPQPRSSDRASYRNPTEALLALAVTQRLLAAGDVTSAAILTPYRGQVRLIEALSRQRGLEAGWAAAGLEVAISTVDGYQGREADVVVFSAVRANDRGAVGFLSDPRRMNVAITRPRRGLVVLGDTGTLTRGSADWNTYVKWVRAQGVVVADDAVIDVDAVLGGGGGGRRL